MLNCDEFVELVTAYLEGQLEPDTERRFVAHLAECDGCARYLDQIHTTVRTLGQPTQQNLSDDAHDRLLFAFASGTADRWPRPFRESAGRNALEQPVRSVAQRAAGPDVRGHPGIASSAAAGSSATKFRVHVQDLHRPAAAHVAWVCPQEGL